MMGPAIPNCSHYVFLGYLRGTPDKRETARFTRSHAHPIAILVPRNGAIMTGPQPDGRFLAVIDLDVDDGAGDLPLAALDPASANTLVVRSGRGGLHAYFYVVGGDVDSAKGIESVHPLVKQVDRRGKGGLIFPPGCAFADHAFRPYEIVLDQPIVSLSDNDSWVIWDIFGKTRFEQRSKDPRKSAEQRHEATVRKARAAGRCDVPADVRQIEHSNIDAYSTFPPCIGTLLVCCARGEHLYHDERLFLASFMNAQGWDADEVIAPLFKHMPDYDAAETAKQVAQIVAKGYKPAGCAS